MIIHKINYRQKKGFIRTTLIIVGALVILKYTYGIDVVEFLTTGNFRKVLDKFYEFGQTGWQKYEVIIRGVWKYLSDIIKNIFSKF